MVVVPLGTSQFWSVEQGFLTQRVTLWLNVACCILIVALICRTLATRRTALGLLTAGLAIITGTLVLQHSRLTTLMDSELRGVVDGFYPLHATYLWLTTVQWLRGLCIPFVIREDAQS